MLSIIHAQANKFLKIIYKSKRIMPNRNRAQAEKQSRLCTAILGGILIAAIIASWHLYDYFIHRKAAERDIEIENEIHELTQRLFADEQKHNRYLAQVNYQGKTKSHDRSDHAQQPLLKLHDDLLETDTSSTTYLMRRLFDNYELDTLKEELVTEGEKQEEFEFLAAILKTPTMKHAMKFLWNKGYVSADHKLQFKLLHDIWFNQYSRGQRRVGSSGFEHVFLAEIRDHNILGLHNWIYFYEQEKNGALDYKGYIEKVDLGKDDQHLLAVRFTFHNIPKQYNTLFVGTSPELEMSLYTVCFILSMDQRCPVQLGETKFSIMTHSWDWHGKKMIGSAYPTIET